MIFQTVVLFFTAFCAASEIHGQRFKFAASYGDHMVLQRAPSKAKLWGYAEADASISLDLFGVKYLTIARKVDWSSSYVWKIVLMPVQANNKSATIEILQTMVNGTVSKIRLFDVLFGDVWMCAGQSNMCMELSRTFNGSDEAKKWPHYGNIRLLQIQQKTSNRPLNDFAKQTTWWAPSETILTRFSAVCWYFGREVYDKLNVPIGLIENCVGLVLYFFESLYVFTK